MVGRRVCRRALEDQSGDREGAGYGMVYKKPWDIGEDGGRKVILCKNEGCKGGCKN